MGFAFDRRSTPSYSERSGPSRGLVRPLRAGFEQQPRARALHAMRTVEDFPNHMSTHTTTALSSAGRPPEQAASEADTFAALFEASISAGDFGKEGSIVRGTIVAVQRDNVVIDIGGKSEGIIALNEFADAQGQTTVKPGDQVDVFIESRENDDGLVTLSKEKADKMKVWDEISAACERDELIEGTISQRVKGGLSVTIRGGVKAFLPGS